ncbi:MAG: SufD family Fe-S cluster assembly protein [Paracoccus sp. (in: a-proteobacteria)]|uniref:SufB/SufD family protein n=1 Tax=Paracoccus sp. TaxID=267 RepID=UPI0026E03A0D|nr:SufD family Fe-S cluster assembly protein [Paracoccus sp. (in: a-proteobacteria)]MDO5631942.1 SufD family Fe-S cluster assembly protein [Paracoccus sp. (in: a-proteobacteria)]
MAGVSVKTAEVAPAVQGQGGAASGDRLAGLVPAAGRLAAAARADALTRLRAMGLPKPRDEYWRYTDPARFNSAVPAPLATNADGADAPLFSDLDRLRLVFVDGVFDAAASDAPELDGVQIDLLSAVADDAGHWAAGLFGTLEQAGQVPVARPFAALNTACATEGVLIRVTGRPARPIHILHRRRDPGADVMWHHVVRVEPGAELTLLETGETGARSNGVIEADLAETGRLHLISSKRAAQHKLGISHLFARVAREAVFKSFALSVNGDLMRQEGVIDIQGDDAVAHIAGAALGDGATGNFHHDDTVFITHAAERCESRQVFKKVLKNGARGVFQGKILVRPGAQKTDGYQISQALLLDEDSQFLAKPELEIYADDVKCSHGSTTGALDEDAMFYLRSRGVPRDRAIVFLVLSFLADALDEIEDDTLRGQISDRLEAWLTQHAATR